MFSLNMQFLSNKENPESENREVMQAQLCLERILFEFLTIPVNVNEFWIFLAVVAFYSTPYNSYIQETNSTNRGNLKLAIVVMLCISFLVHTETHS